MKLLIIIFINTFIQPCFPQKHLFEISRILVDGKVISFKNNDTLALKANRNEIFVELNSNLEKDSTFHYRLDNYTKNWQESKFPIFHFMNLEGGQYSLEIYSGTKNINIPFKVQNALWQKWWFWPVIAFYILVLVGVGSYLFFLYNYRQKLKLQTIRNKIASDLHDEVGSNLSSISIYTELLRKKTAKNSPELMPILDKVIENSKESVSLMRDTVWAINPLNDGMDKLFERMKAFANEILGAKNMDITFDIDPQCPKAELSMEQRKDFYMIFKEAVNNIAKHAKATHANIHIKNTEKGMQMNIADNGIGFDSNIYTEGNGQRIFKERAEESGFEVVVTSKIGEGTVVRVNVN